MYLNEYTDVLCTILLYQCYVWCWFICDSIEIDLQQEEERDFTISHCKSHHSLYLIWTCLHYLHLHTKTKSLRICVGISKGHRKRPLHTIRYDGSWILPHKGQGQYKKECSHLDCEVLYVHMFSCMFAKHYLAKIFLDSFTKQSILIDCSASF